MFVFACGWEDLPAGKAKEGGDRGEKMFGVNRRGGRVDDHDKREGEREGKRERAKGRN